MGYLALAPIADAMSMGYLALAPIADARGLGVGDRGYLGLPSHSDTSLLQLSGSDLRQREAGWLTPALANRSLSTLSSLDRRVIFD